MLLGRDHPDLGQVAIERAGRVAIALTRGRHPKAYPYTDPNEDTVQAAVGGELVLMAVADGHHGHQASHLAIQAIHHVSPDLAGLPPETAVAAAMTAAGDALAAATPERTSPATTLTVVAVRGGEGAAAGWGDSAAALFHGRRAESLTVRQPAFVRAGGPVPPVGDLSTFPASPGDTVVVASDGLTDFVLQPWLRTLAGVFAGLTDPGEVVEAAVQAAGAGGGGDNLAVATLCVDS